MLVKISHTRYVFNPFQEMGYNNADTATVIILTINL